MTPHPHAPGNPAPGQVRQCLRRTAGRQGPALGPSPAAADEDAASLADGEAPSGRTVVADEDAPCNDGGAQSEPDRRAGSCRAGSRRAGGRTRRLMTPLMPRRWPLAARQNYRPGRARGSDDVIRQCWRATPACHPPTAHPPPTSRRLPGEAHAEHRGCPSPDRPSWLASFRGRQISSQSLSHSIMSSDR